MCQLSLVASNDPIINRTILYGLLVSNSISNKDGTGWYNPTNKTIFKVKEEAGLIRGRLSASLAPEKSEVLLGHVRNASFTLGKGRIVSDDKAHPFQSANFILFHNGGIERKVCTYHKEEADMIDTEIFLNELEKDYEKEKDFVKCINITMSKFQGKFAFMIAHGDDIYVIRGKTADLYHADIVLGGELIGEIVNTSDTTADKALADITYYYTLWGANLEFSKFALLEKESIYKLEGLRLTRIADIKENDKPVYNYTAYNQQVSRRWDSSLPKVKIPLTIVDRLYNYICEMGFTIEELDRIFELSTNCGILQCSEEDINKDVFPVLEEFQKRFNSNRKIKRQWEDLKKLYLDQRPIELYSYLGIQFPYFLQQGFGKILAEEQHKAKVDSPLNTAL